MGLLIQLLVKLAMKEGRTEYLDPDAPQIVNSKPVILVEFFLNLRLICLVPLFAEMEL
jgi:hypothetical protein